MTKARKTIRYVTVCLVGVLAVPSAMADLVYRIVYGSASRVITVEAPFSADQQLAGYIDVSFAARTSGSFYARRPNSSVSRPIPPVLDFRFSLGEFEWTPVEDHGLLGNIDRFERISSITLGLERDACGGFSPCFLDLSNDGNGRFEVKIYQPGVAGDPPVVGYRADGIELVSGSLR